MSQSYIQLLVPLDQQSQWYRQLQSALATIPARWQGSGFHITIAFINNEFDMTGAKRVADIIDGVLRGTAAPVITFDKLDVFTGNSGEKHIVNLTASVIPPEFTNLVKQIRYELRANGYELQPHKLHVTLVRVPTSAIDLKSLQNKVGRIEIPPMPRSLNKVNYCFRQGHKHPIREWELLHS